MPDLLLYGALSQYQVKFSGFYRSSSFKFNV